MSATATTIVSVPISSGAEAVHERHVQRLQRKTLSTQVLSSLPDDVYYSDEIYLLERRAIFSRRWFLVCHKARFGRVGDYVQYEMAGFNFVLVKDKSGSIIGFHNICRHRAFPIVQQSEGNARIFSCQYHGWAYDLNGKLTKAPRFTVESTPSFELSKVRLFRIHVHLDRNGFAYVNLDAAAVPKISWESQYSGLDAQDVLAESGIDWEAVEYDFTWTKEGGFNWKVMQDNYNECYHCQTAHPDVAKTTALETYFVVPSATGAYISHFSEPKASVLQSSAFDATRFKGRSQTYVFPGGHFSPNPGTGFMHLMRSCPLSATTTRQEYDVYKLNTSGTTPEAHERMVKFYQKVINEDFELCEGVQRNLERGIWGRGPLHPSHEEGVRAFQDMVLKDLQGHAEREKQIGREIWPARPDEKAAQRGDAAKEEGYNAVGRPMSSLCQRLRECGLARSAEVEW